MQDLTRARAHELLNAVPLASIAVIGDVMIDRYFWGSVSRVSPEAPVPVVDVDMETFHLGGAANVAANLLSLGSMPLMCGVIGDDAMGRQLRQLTRDAGLSDEGLIEASGRPTTVKTRVIGNNQQIVRLDREMRSNVGEDVVERITNVLRDRPLVRAIVLEDYDKGLLTSSLIASVMALAKERNCLVLVDPKHRNFWSYRGAWLVKPNRKEAEEALGRTFTTDAEIIEAGIELLQRLEASNVLITLGSAGMMLFESNGHISSVPTVAKHVADVSGAGDTAIATLAVLAAAGATVREAAAAANVAAGLVVAEPGIVTISASELLQAMQEDESIHEQR